MVEFNIPYGEYYLVSSCVVSNTIDFKEKKHAKVTGEYNRMVSVTKKWYHLVGHRSQSLAHSYVRTS